MNDDYGLFAKSLGQSEENLEVDFSG